jgi:peptide/nickel transport system substrate-binding protein
MEGWFGFVKDQVSNAYFGIYDVVRMNTMWLDR